MLNFIRKLFYSFRIPFWIIIITHTVDLILTTVIHAMPETSNHFYEVNPFGRWQLSVGYPAVVMTKILLVAFGLGILYSLKNIALKRIHFVTWGMAWVMIYLMYHWSQFCYYLLQQSI